MKLFMGNRIERTMAFYKGKKICLYHRPSPLSFLDLFPISCSVFFPHVYHVVCVCQSLSTCVCTHGFMHMGATVHVWRSEDYSQEKDLTFDLTGFGNRT